MKKKYECGLGIKPRGISSRISLSLFGKKKKHISHVSLLSCLLWRCKCRSGSRSKRDAIERIFNLFFGFLSTIYDYDDNEDGDGDGDGD
jgi:hypothetical protein